MDSLKVPECNIHVSTIITDTLLQYVLCRCILPQRRIDVYIVGIPKESQAVS